MFSVKTKILDCLEQSITYAKNRAKLFTTLLITGPLLWWKTRIKSLNNNLLGFVHLILIKSSILQILPINNSNSKY